MKQHYKNNNKWLALLVSLFFCVPLAYAQADKPVISIVIDDMGNNLNAGLQVIALKGPVACSILPYRPYSLELAKRAHLHHKEIILHTPMQAIIPHALGKGALLIDMDKQEFVRTFNDDLHAFPYINGVNNHMGSLLTQSQENMDWLMQVIKQRHLFFIDSRTTADTVAADSAEHTGVPFTIRNVFLDDEISAHEVKFQFERLLSLAKQHGSALAIGHPNEYTLRLLKRELPKLSKRGFRLVSVSELIELQKHHPGAKPPKALAHKPLPLAKPVLPKWHRVPAFPRLTVAI